MTTDIQAREIGPGDGYISPSAGMVNILEASITLFSNLGYGNVSIKDIAKEAGTSTGLIYHHYADKEDLFKKSICRAVEKILCDFETEKGRSRAAEFDVWLHVNAIDNLRLQRMLIMLIDLRSAHGDLSGVDECLTSFYDLERRIISDFLKEGRGYDQSNAAQFAGLTSLVSICLDGVMVRSMIRDEFDIKSTLAELRSLITYYRDHFKDIVR